ncbi:MAG: Rieske (2Fe-2S) protein [Cyanobium sp.]
MVVRSAMGTNPDSDAASTASSSRAVDVAAVTELNRTGQLLVRSSSLGPLLLIRDPVTQQPQAVDPTCPHRGCLVAWNAGASSFLCPCHQARFNAAGRWIGGQPVKRPLHRFRVSVRNGRILVSPI